MILVGAAFVVYWALIKVFEVDKVPQPTAWTDWLLLVASIGFTAAVVYNQTIRNWTQLRQMEGEK